jgi:hypothetical protein
MGAQARDPYQTLGISPRAPDEEVRKAYRRLVQKYHPDHNGGSEESERRFEEVQEAYAKIRELRQAPPRRSSAPPPPPPRRRRSGAGRTPPPRPTTFDPDIEERAAALERELKEAHLARERAREAARQAAAEAARRAAAEAAAGDDDGEAGDRARAGATRPGRPSDEELGYIKTDDSFTKILADARSELSERFSEAQGHPVVRRVSDLIDELDELASKLTGDRHRPEAG